VLVLGLKEVRTLTLALGVQTLARKHLPPPEFGLRTYWTHQLGVAALARELAPSIGQDADDSFTAGLLHDLGKLLMAAFAPDEWQAVDAEARTSGRPYAAVEMERFGLDHGIVGALVLKSWNLPESLSETINWHHAPQRSPDHASQSSLVSLCDGLVVEAALNGTAPGYAPEVLGPDILEPGADDRFADLAQSLGLDLDQTRETMTEVLASEDHAAFVSCLLHEDAA
jgi:putative nucleotidyltransferase with HDIG domain